MMGFGYGMGGWFGHGWFGPGWFGPGGGGLGWIGGLLVLGLLVVAVVLVTRALGGDRRDHRASDVRRDLPREDRAMQILRERYARGEIDREEFERRREGLA